MARAQLNVRLSEAVAEILDRVCEIRGLTRTETVLIGILAQAETFGVIPSLAETLREIAREPKTDPDSRERQRLSQQRSRARKRGIEIPKQKPGPVPRS